MIRGHAPAFGEEDTFLPLFRAVIPKKSGDRRPRVKASLARCVRPRPRPPDSGEDCPFSACRAWAQSPSPNGSSAQVFQRAAQVLHLGQQRLHGLPALGDLPLHPEVGQKAVPQDVEELRKAADLSGVQVKVRLAGVEQAARALQLALGAADQLFGVAELAVLDEAGDQPAAQQVEDSPAACAFQPVQRPSSILQLSYLLHPVSWF